MKDTLKSIGSFIVGICILTGLGFVARMLLDGCVWLNSQTPTVDDHVVLPLA